MSVAEDTRSAISVGDITLERTWKKLHVTRDQLRSVIMKMSEVASWRTSQENHIASLETTVKTLSLQVSILTANILPPVSQQAGSEASDDSLKHAVSHLEEGVPTLVGSDIGGEEKLVRPQQGAVKPATATLQPPRSRRERYANSLQDPPPDAASDADQVGSQSSGSRSSSSQQFSLGRRE